MILISLNNTILNMFDFITTLTIISILFLYIFDNKDFKKLLKNIKKVAFSRQADKATLIQNLIIDYFFD